MTYRGEYRTGPPEGGDPVPQNVPQSRGNVCYVTPADGVRLPAGPSNLALIPFPERARIRAQGSRELHTLRLGPIAREPHDGPPVNPDRCAWPRRGLPAGAYLDVDGRVRGACECECGCRRTERKYRRCQRCGAGRHPLPQSAPIPLAARAAMSFGLWGDKPPTAEALRGRLDSHLRNMRGPEPRGEGDPDARQVSDTTRRGGVRRLAAS